MNECDSHVRRWKLENELDNNTFWLSKSEMEWLQALAKVWDGVQVSCKEILSAVSVDYWSSCVLFHRMKKKVEQSITNRTEWYIRIQRWRPWRWGSTYKLQLEKPQD